MASLAHALKRLDRLARHLPMHVYVELRARVMQSDAGILDSMEFFLRYDFLPEFALRLAVAEQWARAEAPNLPAARAWPPEGWKRLPSEEKGKLSYQRIVDAHQALSTLDAVIAEEELRRK